MNHVIAFTPEYPCFTNPGTLLHFGDLVVKSHCETIPGIRCSQAGNGQSLIYYKFILKLFLPGVNMNNVNTRRKM
jgi:hypothetical protein